MKPIVVEKDGRQRDMDWLVAKYGVKYVPAPVGEKRFALYQVVETEGPATLVVRVKQGLSGLPKHAVAMSWPDAPVDLTKDDTKAWLTRYAPRAAIQWTSDVGDTGFGLGNGSYIKAEGAGGPHAVWVLHHQYRSDVLDKVGMLAGTNHMGPLRLVFDLVDAEVAAVPQSCSALFMAWVRCVLGRR